MGRFCMITFFILYPSFSLHPTQFITIVIIIIIHRSAALIPLKIIFTTNVAILFALSGRRGVYPPQSAFAESGVSCFGISLLLPCGRGYFFFVALCLRGMNYLKRA